MDLETFLLFEDDEDLVLRVATSRENDRAGGLTQRSAHNIESIKCDLE